MEGLEHYKVLGVSSNASEEQIKDAYENHIVHLPHTGDTIRYWMRYNELTIAKDFCLRQCGDLEIKISLTDKQVKKIERAEQLDKYLNPIRSTLGKLEELTLQAAPYLIMTTGIIGVLHYENVSEYATNVSKVFLVLGGGWTIKRIANYARAKESEPVKI